MVRKNVANREATISRTIKQKNHKRDEDNMQKHQKQGTFLRKAKTIIFIMRKM